MRPTQTTYVLKRWRGVFVQLRVYVSTKIVRSGRR